MQQRLLERFRSLLGLECVVTDPERLVRYERATFPVERTVPLVLLPSHSQQVPAIVQIANEAKAAFACERYMAFVLGKAGYPPFRLGVQSMQSLHPHSKSYVELVRRLKMTLDPNDVLAPGRYDFRGAFDARHPHKPADGSSQAPKVHQNRG